jgi:hypothetical protein
MGTMSRFADRADHAFQISVLPGRSRGAEMSAHLTLMLNAILIGIRFVILVFSGHKQVALENAALR